MRIDNNKIKDIEKNIYSILINAMIDGYIEYLNIVKIELFGSRIYGTPRKIVT